MPETIVDDDIGDELNSDLSEEDSDDTHSDITFAPVRPWSPVVSILVVDSKP